MPRQPHRSIDAPWHKDEEPDWKGMTKADAIRQASKLLGGERSPIKVIRFLEQRDVRVSSPQATKVLGEMTKTKTPKPGTETLAHSVQAVIAIQRFAAEHGGLEAVAGKLAEAERLLAFANEVGGIDVFREIVLQLQASK